MRRFSLVSIGTPVLALVVMATSSCTGDPNVNASNTTGTIKSRKRDKQVIALGEMEGEKALEERFAFDPRSLKKDNRGNFVGAVRSQYEGRRSVAFGGGVGTATDSYKTNRYSAPGWKGITRANTKVYGGNTDGSRFQTPSQFRGTSASQTAQHSRFQGTTARTNNYPAGTAHENSSQRLAKPTDAWTDFRRRVFPQPSRMRKAEHDRLTVDETRSILGREE
ncbi:MAG: hypothetical protein VCA35_14560 [Roseibacillus sp.]